jgi:hypothetical protein
MAFQCNVGEVLQELRFRRAHKIAEIEGARQYLRAVSDHRGRRQIEDDILSHTAVAAELESSTILITSEDADSWVSFASKTRRARGIRSWRAQSTSKW